MGPGGHDGAAYRRVRTPPPLYPMQERWQVFWLGKGVAGDESLLFRRFVASEATKRR